MSGAVYPGQQLCLQIRHVLHKLPDLQTLRGVQEVGPGQLPAGRQGDFLPGERVRRL